MSISELKQLQESIIRKNKKCNLIGAIVIVASALLLIFIMLLAKKDLFILPFIIVIEFIIFLIVKNTINSKDIEKFNKEFKNIFVLKSLQNFFGDVFYRQENGFSEEYINQVGMLYTGDSFSSNDYISGSYKNIKFEQSDIHIQERREEKDSNGNTTVVWVTIFLGRLMIFDFYKNFKANIRVASNNFGASTLPRKKNFSKVKMEDVEFNKKFSVCAENEHDAFYILTPNFMEKIKDITKKLNCGIMLGFVDSKLHIALDNNKDSFEYNVFKPINEKEIEEYINKDIKIITDFVDELNLDNDLFKK